MAQSPFAALSAVRFANPKPRKHLKALILAATAIGSALSVAAPAQAQSNEIGEIIVTARKRQESLLNVPVIETAIPQEQIDRMQMRDIREISKLVPGLTFAQALGNGGVQLALRGVGTTSLDPSIEQTVALNIDGMQLGQGLAFQSAMFDLGQIEVLKGPQSLFYGKSSPGGVVSVRTADPTDAFEVVGRYGYEFEALEHRGELIVSGPLTDTIKARLSAMYADQRGFFHNPAVALPGTGAVTPSRNRAFPAENYTIRGTLLWNPTENFDARLKGTVTHDRIIQSGSGQYVYCPEGITPHVSVPGVNGGQPIPFVGGGEDCKKDRTIRVVDLDPAAFYNDAWNDGVPYLDTMQKYSTLEMNYRLQPELTLTSQTGFYYVRSASMSNSGTSTYAGPAATTSTRYRRQDFSQELRLNSDYEGPFNFTGGLFYQKAFFSFDSTQVGNSIYRQPRYLSAWIFDIDVTSISPFGQLRYQITPEIEVAGGVRYTDETRKQTQINYATGVVTRVNPPVPKIESKTWSPELTISYRPTDAMTMFGSLKQGYKSGSFNAGTLPSATLSNAFDDEKVRGGELGVKSRLLDRTLALELAGYYYKYTGLQVGTSEPANPGSPPVARVVNAGSAKVRGIEFSSSYRPEQIEGLGMFLNANWNKGKFGELTNIPCAGGQLVSEGCNLQFNPATGRFTAQDLSGLPLPRAPKWQVSFGFDYERPVGHGLTLVVSNTNFYTSKYLTTLRRGSQYYQDAYMKNDLSLAVRGPEDRWEFAVIGKNIGNRITTGNCTGYNAVDSTVLGRGSQITGGTTRGVSGVDEVACRFDRGREIWLRLTLRPFN